MDQCEKSPPTNAPTSEDTTVSASKARTRGKKRKRRDSDSSSDVDDIFPENALEIEKSLHASAIKNNLDDVSVKKILKKVVTNDHVLALVKLREEEEISSSKKQNMQPKLTRAKAKELMGVATKSAPWNLSLTPIKHIPVKTRPEVEALISKDLPEDEDDEEYQPTHEDVPSDDDQTLESCSDLDSQPATPATPTSVHNVSPCVIKDGPFKVPVGLQTPARRKLVIVEEEEATIARRTRSKINLSSTTIEHIESSFVPPDDVPMPIGDDLWNQFLEECLNPGEASKHEDDDEADPEYNVAADADSHREDEALDRNILRISKKELNDLVTELFSIIPEPANDELAENLAQKVLTDGNTDTISSPFEGKQEPLSDDENQNKVTQTSTETTGPRRDSTIIVSIGKSEPGEQNEDASETVILETTNSTLVSAEEIENEIAKRTHVSEAVSAKKTNEESSVRAEITQKGRTVVNIAVEEQTLSVNPGDEVPKAAPPPLLRSILESNKDVTHVQVTVDQSVKFQPVQLQILEQQLRQHIQLATSNFMQLYVNPSNWNLAPTYKEYLHQFEKMIESNPNSVVNVCNLKPALELIKSWESTVSDDTPENKELVEFIQKQDERNRLRYEKHHLYMGDFPELFMKVIANSTVFLYPYLLPAMPYKPDSSRKFQYRLSEDEYIAIGMDQFWQYVEDNPELYKRPKQVPENVRWGLSVTCGLVIKHMLPWLTSKMLMSHVLNARKKKCNPIARFFAERIIMPVQHKLLAYNPKLTLYEQPEHEMPRLWVRYLAKNSQRFRNHYFKKRVSGVHPEGVSIETNIAPPKKNPLPGDFTKKITNRLKKPEHRIDWNKIDVQIYTGKGNNDATVTENAKNLELNQMTNVPPAVETLNGSVLIINPMTSINTDNIRSTQNKVKGKVPIPADATKTNVVKPTTQVLGRLIPCECVNNFSITNEKPVITTVTDVTSETATISPANTTTQPENNFSLAQNTYRVVHTNAGAYLIPLTMVVQNTSTVNSINGPISSSKDNSLVGNDLPEAFRNSIIDGANRITEKLKSHCKCCILMKKICKERQTHITEFFKPKNTQEKKCECTHRKYPKISKRLKLLINNYKGKSWCELKRIQSLLNSADKECNKLKDSAGQCDKVLEEDYNLEDIAYVTTYNIKLVQRSSYARNFFLKQKINDLFTKFDPDFNDPVNLTCMLYDALIEEMADIYREFIGFLTAEQADSVNMFKDYFLQNCIGELVKRVEAEVEDKEKRRVILDHLNGVFTEKVSSSCELCFGILIKMKEHPRLARYTFSLFPHRVTAKDGDRYNQQRKSNASQPQSDEISTQSTSEVPTNNLKQSTIQTVPEVSNLEQETEANDRGTLTICEESTFVMSHEDEHSISNGSNEDIQPISGQKNTEFAKDPDNIKSEANPADKEDSADIVNKMEIPEHDISQSTVMSPLVMSEDEPIKLEWKRDEDKLILQMILQYLTPQARRYKTVLEILEEKNVYQLIAEDLPDKSTLDVKERVMYLLEILVLSEY